MTVPNPAEVWDDDQYVSFDFETTGDLPEYALQPWRVRKNHARATSLAWVFRKDGALVTGGGLHPDPLMMAAFLQWSIDEGKTLVGWNVQFDIQWFIAYGFKHLVDQCRWLDGMLLWRHLEIEPEYETTRVSKRSYSLKTAVAEHLPQYAGYQEGIDFHGNDPAELAKLHTYNIRDCIFTLRLARKFYLALKPKQRQAVWIEAQCLGLIADANYEGLPIDTLMAKALSAKLKVIAAQKLASLTPHGVTEKIVRSPIQMAKLLYDQWLLPVLKHNTSKLTGKTTRSTDKTVLHELAFMDGRAKELREYREALNNDTKFATTPWVSAEYCDDRGRAHPNARVFGTYSGRLTYSSKQGKNKDERPIGWAIHQSKKGPEFRGIVVAPPGYTIVEFDAAGQEFKLMACASNDLTMLQLCLPGEDPHSFMGAKITKTDYRALIAAVAAEVKSAKDARQLGKVANLCLPHSFPILTNRGHVAIQDVRRDDLVWDGIEFVAHDGVVCSGVREVITHDGVTATPEHKVLVDGQWVELRIAKRTDSCIQRGVVGWDALRVVDGIVARHRKAAWRQVLTVWMRLWSGLSRAVSEHGKREIDIVQGVRLAGKAHAGGASHQPAPHRSNTSAARGQLVFPVQQSERWFVPKLWSAWDRVQVWFGQGGCGVYQTNSTAYNLQGGGHRQDRQRRPLRAGQPSAGHTQAELAEQTWFQHGYVEGGIDPDAKLGRKSILADLYDALCGSRAFWRSYPTPRPRGRSGEAQGLAQDRSEVPVYDIVNCGPRTRFSANGRIVHNSLQYRTSAKKLRVVARVDYGIPMMEPQAYDIHNTYRSTYHRVPDYWERQIAIVSRKGYAETFAGRRVQVKGDWNGKNSWSMGSTAINYRIQGTGADQKYLALMMIRDYLTTIGARFFFDLHDGIYLLIPDRYAKSAAAHILSELNNLPYAQCWGFLPPIPLTWDCKMGKTWGSLKAFTP